jgi:hypothetical protein
MRPLCFVCLFCCSGFALKAQEFGALQIGLVYNRDVFFQQGLQNHRLGLQYQVHITKWLSLSNRSMIGLNKDQKLMYGYGVAGFFMEDVFFMAAPSAWSSTLVLLPFLAPEGINLHFGSERFSFSPYFYPSSIQYNGTLEQREVYFWETGLRFQITDRRGWVIPPHLSWKQSYDRQWQAVGVGVSLGLTRKAASPFASPPTEDLPEVEEEEE